MGNANKVLRNFASAKAENSSEVRTFADLCIEERKCIFLMQNVNKCRVNLCDELIYTIYIFNMCNKDIDELVLLDIFPRGAELISCDGNCKQPYDKNKVICTIKNIKKCSYAKIVLKVRVRKCGTAKNIAKVISPDYADDVENNPSVAVSYVNCKNCMDEVMKRLTQNTILDSYINNAGC